ncbi:MAG: CCA tRNA nucleotidyltransferase [Alphaproteobacteria bacterium]
MQKFVVGGAVRDKVLGLKPNDFDYVVIGATPEDMLAAGYKRVGKDFPVFLDDNGYEHALARKEIKTGPKHTDFVFDFGPHVTLEEDVERRDFTCNALVYDEKNKKIIDLVGGLNDIKSHILRHVNSAHFGEDPLRVLRMCRFAAQLDFTIAPETMALARQMVAGNMLAHLTKERIWKEFEKALNTPHFNIFIDAMNACNALSAVLPDINTAALNFSYPETDISPVIKFALWTYSQSITDIDYICKKINVPNEYRHLALLLKNHTATAQIYPQLLPQQKVQFLTDICQLKSLPILEDFLCAADILSALGNTRAQCLKDFALIAPIKASDIPNFDVLPKGPEISKALFDYRAKLLESNCPVKQS